MCADSGYAPELLHVERNIIPTWIVVIMAYIEDAVQLKETNLSQEDYEQVMETVDKAVQLLHDRNYVFGDLRSNNVLVRRTQTVFLIDFDWVGQHGNDVYPSFMNHMDIQWPDGAEDSKTMLKEHDLEWLERLNRSGSFETKVKRARTN